MGIAPSDGIVSPAYFVFDFDVDRPRIWPSPFRSRPYVAHFGQASDGVRVRPVGFDDCWNAADSGAVPPPAEQAAIVRFLDWANGRLERAIRAKRKVIALLNEQKQAIIHRAVTRGLDPSVPLKPSGIPWLGDIPQHWEVRRLKFVANKIVDCLHATPRYSVEDTIRDSHSRYYFGSCASSKGEEISSRDYAFWTERLEPIEGDILYSREGARFGIGVVFRQEFGLCISQRMMRRSGSRTEHCSHFLMWLLNSRPTYGQALQDVKGATAPM